MTINNKRDSNIFFTGNECRKILKHLDSLEVQLPEEHKPYLTALYALTDLNLMANMVMYTKYLNISEYFNLFLCDDGLNRGDFGL